LTSLWNYHIILAAYRSDWVGWFVSKVLVGWGVKIGMYGGVVWAVSVDRFVIGHSRHNFIDLKFKLSAESEKVELGDAFCPGRAGAVAELFFYCCGK
jgi:hypothetical protein